MKSNQGYSNTLIILVSLFILAVGGFFGYKNYYKHQINQENGKSNPTIIKKDNYLLIVDKNSSKTIYISIPTNTIIDSSFYYGESVTKDTKKITQVEKYEFDDYHKDAQIYGLKYTPKLIIPEISGQLGGCGEFEIRISGFNKSYNSILERNRKDAEKFAIDFNNNYKLNEKEFTLNNFKANTFDNMPSAGNGQLETLIQVDDTYSLTISTSCQGSMKDGRNDSYIDLYNQILDSVSETVDKN